MHEVVFAQQIAAVLVPSLEDTAVTDVKTVHVTVGELRAIDREILDHAFAQVPKHRKLARARIALSVIPVTAHCDACGYTGAVTQGADPCPACGQGMSLTGGKEFTVTGIEW